MDLTGYECGVRKAENFLVTQVTVALSKKDLAPWSLLIDKTRSTLPWFTAGTLFKLLANIGTEHSYYTVQPLHLGNETLP